MLLDDAHWVDADTRTVLALAVDELTGKGVVFAVATRTDEPGAADVHDLVARTRRDLVTVVPLRGLDAGAVGEMVRGLSAPMSSLRSSRRSPGVRSAIRSSSASCSD